MNDDLDKFLAAFREAYYAHSALRIGQILSNALEGDPFYRSNEDLIQQLRDYSQRSS